MQLTGNRHKLDNRSSRQSAAHPRYVITLLNAHQVPKNEDTAVRGSHKPIFYASTSSLKYRKFIDPQSVNELAVQRSTQGRGPTCIPYSWSSTAIPRSRPQIQCAPFATRSRRRPGSTTREEICSKVILSATKAWLRFARVTFLRR